MISLPHGKKIQIYPIFCDMPSICTNKMLENRNVEMKTFSISRIQYTQKYEHANNGDMFLFHGKTFLKLNTYDIKQTCTYLIKVLWI